MSLPLMPKATAVWLVENTALTFEQIAQFCGMHSLEIQAIADGDVGAGMMGLNPIANGQLTQEEITRCEADEKAVLKRNVSDLPALMPRSKGARYTPMAKRQDKPDAIAWLLKHQPDLTDAQIRKLIGTTKNSIDAVRGRTHWNMANIKARNPVLLGLCTEADLEKAVAQAPKSLNHAESAVFDVEDADEE
ncbi:MAG: DUF1013 domain-containing protein [Alphaproteobacteria bacterium]